MCENDRKEQFVIAEWNEDHTKPRKLTAHENGDGWLILMQKKIYGKWNIEETYYSEYRPKRGEYF